jgi:hypothetical protein
MLDVLVKGDEGAEDGALGLVIQACAACHLGMGLLLRVTNNQEGYSMFRRFTKKRVVVALSVVAALAVAGGAIAYFTSSGSGTGHGTVGSSTPFTVAVNDATGGPLLPGSGTETLAYTITNPSGGTQNLAHTAVAVHADANQDITDHGTSVAGCKAAWFSATDNAPTYGPIAGGAHVSGSVTLTMPDNTTDNQDPCQGSHPDIAVNAS